jgi:hypothetical protein
MDMSRFETQDRYGTLEQMKIDQSSDLLPVLDVPKATI